MKLKTYLSIFAVILVVGLFSSCQKEDNSETLGTANIEITDAPIDDANVESAVLTISEIKIDGESVESYEAATFDLMAYRNGQTKQLISTDLSTGSYESITLVLQNQDVDGNSPGCYVLDKDGTKHPLSTNTINLEIGSSFDINEGENTDLVIDFDLRKLIKYTGDPQDAYEFAEFNTGIRLLNKAKTGTIEGNAESAFSGSDKVVVYAYAKGTFDRGTETDGGGESYKQFAKAITSADVQDGGAYSLHFLQEGRYELHFASYQEQNDGSMMLNGTLELDVLGSIDITDIQVDAENETTVNVSITGINFL